MAQHRCVTEVLLKRKKSVIRQGVGKNPCHPHDKMTFSVSNKRSIYHSVNTSSKKDIMSYLSAIKSRHRTTCCCSQAKPNSKGCTVLICQTVREISRCFSNQLFIACFWRCTSVWHLFLHLKWIFVPVSSTHMKDQLRVRGNKQSNQNSCSMLSPLRETYCQTWKTSNKTFLLRATDWSDLWRLYNL